MRPHRLSRAVLPRRYDLHVEVDPARGPAYRGEVAIDLELAKAARTIELHASELRLAGAAIEVGGRTLPGRVTLDPSRELARVAFARAVPKGEARLRLRFSGALRHDLRGLYGATSGERRYAFSQLEAADARRFFPCFDEPSFKARLRLGVTTGSGNAVVSNAPIEAAQALPDGRKRVGFAETPPLSTYLYALCVGELEASRAERCGPTEIRIWHVPGKGHLTEFALETARETLARLERYFDLPYPYAKLDLVAAPDFEAGAMENAGCVLFRETLLLVDPETVTLAEKKRVGEVVCHELAHMWYGDLVTMAWWDDLWLNEAFATWMAFQIVDGWKPEWKMWLDFEHHRAAALGLDALGNTHPIYTTVRTPADATQNFDLITYEKGASVVRMVERYLGAEKFREGVRLYMRRHREGNTVAADLWRALGEASGEKIEPVVRAWIEQPGFPQVALRVASRAGATELELRQERFRAKPRRAGAPRVRERWPIPFVARVGEPVGGTRLERRLVTGSSERLPLGASVPPFVYGNADEGGFFRPLHDAEALGALVRGLDGLSSVERMGLIGHQWAFVRNGQAPVDGVLELAAALGAEREPDVLLALRGPLAFLEEQVAPAAGGDTAARLHGFVAETFGPAARKLGWDPAPSEAAELRLRRSALVGLLGLVAEWAPVVDEAARRLDAYLSDRRSLEPNLADAVVALAAQRGDAKRFEAYLKALESATTPQERRRFLLALGDFREPGLVERVLGLTLTEAVPTQDVAMLLARLLGNRAAREATWRFVKRRWSRLRRRMPPMLVTRLVEATPALQTPAYKRDVAAFFRAARVPTAERALKQALERFDLNAELRRRAAPGLRRWLEGRRS
ncbi:MAG TPA: M1 family metallopeptidase [Myxococcota bacterium]|nr:M1 family metallopeptidase [Myxococcota bacterium]